MAKLWTRTGNKVNYHHNSDLTKYCMIHLLGPTVLTYVSNGNEFENLSCCASDRRKCRTEIVIHETIPSSRGRPIHSPVYTCTSRLLDGETRLNAGQFVGSSQSSKTDCETELETIKDPPWWCLPSCLQDSLLSFVHSHSSSPPNRETMCPVISNLHSKLQSTAVMFPILKIDHKFLSG